MSRKLTTSTLKNRALAVYSGREAYNGANPQAIWGSQPEKPGLHVSCLPFIRDNDVCLIIWDMTPSPHAVNVRNLLQFRSGVIS